MIYVLWFHKKTRTLASANDNGSRATVWTLKEKDRE